MGSPSHTDLTQLAASVSNEVRRHWDVQADRISWHGNVEDYLGDGSRDIPETRDEFLERIHPEHRGRVREELERWLASDAHTCTTTYLFRGPHSGWIEVRERARVARDERGAPKVVVASLLEVRRRALSAPDGGAVTTFGSRPGETREGGSSDGVRTGSSEPSAEVESEPGPAPRSGAQVEHPEDWDMYRALTENASDVITVMSHSGEILYESPSLKRVLGYAPPELVGRNAFEFIHPDDRQRVRKAWEARPGEAGFVDVVEYRCRHADGSWRHLESSGRRPPDDSEIEGVVVHSRDVTERRELEQRLQEARKMEAVGRLVSGIAHDFNNLLTVITCDTDILLQDLEGHPRREEVEEIRDAAHRAGTLTRDLLAFGRQENLRLREIDLVRAFRNLAPTMDEKLGEDVEFHLDATVDQAWVRVDPALARQVVFDLVSNARDAMPEGGVFRIEAQKVRVGSDSPERAHGVEEGDWIAITYSDTGLGMPEAVRERAFEPFFSTKEGRSGLGLSTVYGLVKQSDGEVWIESEPGVGTTIHTYLPDVGDGSGKRTATAADEGAEGTDT